MRIEQIEILEKGKRRISFDNGVSIILYKSEMRQYDLKEGQEVSPVLYEELYYEVVGKRVKKRAMYLLEKQDRTEHQLREKLLASEYPEELIEAAIAYVQSFHYQNDSSYAERFIRNQREKKSNQRMRQDLLQKGVDKDVIEEALDKEGNSDESEAIAILLQKKGYHADMEQKEVYRIYQYILRRGYKSSDILHVMRSNT